MCWTIDQMWSFLTVLEKVEKKGKEMRKTVANFLVVLKKVFNIFNQQEKDKKIQVAGWLGGEVT